ncbi:hypothetical protein TNCV_5062001 [Trichonephila clavipes]|nr:hypothetical protein TNCV_5062001 [Trichonephila clavipes]
MLIFTHSSCYQAAVGIEKDETQTKIRGFEFVSPSEQNAENTRSTLLSEKESDVGELSGYNLNSDEDIIKRKLSKNDCKESEGSADEIDNLPVNPDIYVARNVTRILHNSNVPGRFASRNVL